MVVALLLTSAASEQPKANLHHKHFVRLNHNIHVYIYIYSDLQLYCTEVDPHSTYQMSLEFRILQLVQALVLTIFGN